MKKIYETPICQTVYTDSQDILTSSQFILVDKVNGEGGFGDGGVIKW